MKIERSMIWKKVWILLALVGLTMLAVVGCSPVSAADSAKSEAILAQQESNIKVIGVGEALGQPDEAQVTVGVETFAQEVNEATAENEDTIEAILTALQEAGIATDGIQTSNYSLWAEQKYGDNVCIFKYERKR